MALTDLYIINELIEKIEGFIEVVEQLMTLDLGQHD
jgi:hypothetical protein